MDIKDTALPKRERPEMKYLFRKKFKETGSANFAEWLHSRNPVSNVVRLPKSLNLFRNSPRPSNGSFCAPFFCMVFAYSIEYVKNRTKKICTKISYLLTTGNFERDSLKVLLVCCYRHTSGTNFKIELRLKTKKIA